MGYSWRRPENIPFPKVWSTFQAKDLNSDKLVEYRVEDLNPNRFEDGIKHMTEFYLKNEPMCSSTEILKDTKSTEEIQGLWKLMMEQKLSLVCFKEGSDEIIGINILGMALKEEQDDECKLEGKAWKKIYGTEVFVFSKFNCFDNLNTDKYICAFGLSVQPKYSGRKIGGEILRARIPLGSAIGVKFSSTVFTAIASQKLATNLGFKTNYEISYEELARIKPEFKFDNVETKSILLMSVEID